MSTSVKLLQNLLDYCAVKNKTIAKNISNIGTENYKREDVVFKNLLDENVNSYHYCPVKKKGEPTSY